jgi:hypothetical protein
MLSPAAYLNVLDTLGKLHAHGHGPNGYCRRCGRRFGVLMPFLMAARGSDSPVLFVGMRPLIWYGSLSMERTPEKMEPTPEKTRSASPAARLFRATTELS